MATAPVPIPIGSSFERRRGKFVFLFFAQVMMLVLSPFLDRPGWPEIFFRGLGALTFIAAIYAISTSSKRCITALVLATPAMVLNGVVAFRPERILLVPTAVLSVAFLVFTLVSLLRAVVTAREVTSDTIYGAISVYLLMALTWGALYLLLVTLQPGALRVNTRNPGESIDWGDCVFYSYVTLTSLGYGDIVPATPHARSLSILEAVTGIMYVAVLVARLVALYSTEKSQGAGRATAGD
jgi:hypothetical protein